MSTGLLQVTVIRHGETDSNRLRILQGHLDIPLNDHGRQQARTTGQSIDKPIDHAFSSDLSRCKETLDLIIQETGQSVPCTYSSLLRERDMGDVQGMTVNEAKAFAAAQNKSFHQVGESHSKCVDRLNEAWDNIISTSIEHDWKNVLILSHGGVISKFMAHAVNDKGYALSRNIRSSDLRVPHNCSKTIVLINKTTRQGTVTAFGDASHLADRKTVDQNAL